MCGRTLSLMIIFLLFKKMIKKESSTSHSSQPEKSPKINPSPYKFGPIYLKKPMLSYTKLTKP